MKIEPELHLPNFDVKFDLTTAVAINFHQIAPNITAQRMNRRTSRRWAIQVTGILELLGDFPRCAGGDILPVRSAPRMSFVASRLCYRTAARGERGTKMTRRMLAYAGLLPS
jgi:hypothetical protein